MKARRIGSVRPGFPPREQVVGDGQVVDVPPEPRRTLSDGTQIYPGHREIRPETGQQKGYVVLAEEERAKGFVQPVRYSYVHTKCGVETRINSQTIAETYARDPKFYSGTFCVGCRKHFTFGTPDGKFLWDDGTEVGA